MSNFYDFDWHDSNIEKIEILADKVLLTVDNDCLGAQVKIICSKTAGITNLCMWEDTIISVASLNRVDDFAEAFIQKICDAHPKYESYDCIPIKEGLLDLAIKLTNDIVFHIYCYDVVVQD